MYLYNLISELYKYIYIHIYIYRESLKSDLYMCILYYMKCMFCMKYT